MSARDDEVVGWALWAIPAVSLAAVSIARGTGFDGAADGLRVVGWVLLAMLAAGLAWWARSALQVRRTVQGAMTAHVHAHADAPPSWLQRLIGRHEIGHVVAAEREGMGVESVRIGRGWGFVRARRFVSIDASITFLAAGHRAIRSKRGADGDLAAIDRLSKLIPRAERRARVDAAYARANRHVSAEAGRIVRDGDRLAAEGRYWR